MVNANSMAANKGDAAKEASDYIHKGLEHALYEKVKDLGTGADSIRNCKKKGKAVDFFLRRRARCDKFVRESVAPDREQLEKQAAEEEEKKLAEVQRKSQGAAKIQVEQVEVKPLEGQIKLPPMPVNVKNNSNVARPFGDQGERNWASVSFVSPRVSMSGYDSMMNSYMHNGNTTSIASECAFDTPRATPHHSGQFQLKSGKNYKPVAYMNFKPRNPAWRETGDHQRLQHTDVNDILAQVHAREQADEQRKAAEKRAAEEAAAPRMNGGDPFRLSRMSLADNVGKWRPSNDNWRPGVNTDGYFKALGLLKENAAQKQVDAYKNDSLDKALQKAQYKNESRVRQNDMATGRMGEVKAAGDAKCVQANKQKFV